MKQTLILALSAVLLSVGCGTQDNGNNPGGGNGGNPGGNTGGDPAAITTPLPTATTDIGVPLKSNDAVTTKLDQSGGALVSPDGRLTLVVPAGALAAPATGVLQRITGLMPSGIGVGYRVTLTDDATRGEAALSQPLDLEFTLTDSELSSNDLTLENLTVAYQGAGGAWQLSPDAQITPLGGVRVQSGLRPQGGSGAKITAKLKKGGDYALATRYKLHPRSGSVKVNDKLLLTILNFAPSRVDPISGYADTSVTPIAASNWAVSGVAGGNASVGWLIADDGDSKRSYKAPAKVPSPNPVRVSATITDAGKTVTLASKVRVEDAQGWLNVYADVNHREKKSFPSGGESSLRIEGVMQTKFDATTTSVQAPVSFGGIAYDGGMFFSTKLDPNGTGTFLIEYTSIGYGQCICTPLEGIVKTETTYRFEAADSPTGQGGFGSVSIEPTGSYQFTHAVGLQLKGRYTLSIKKTGSCTNQPPPPDINKSGEDTVSINGDSKGRGTVKPQGPDRMTGANTAYLDVSLPKSFPRTPTVFATIPIGWYFDYAPLTFKNQPFPPTPQAPTPTQTPPAPLSPPREDAVVKPLC